MIRTSCRALAAALLLLAAPGVFAQDDKHAPPIREETVVVEVPNGQGALRLAKQEAQKAATNKVLGTFVDPEKRQEHAAFIENDILANAEQFTEPVGMVAAEKQMVVGDKLKVEVKVKVKTQTLAEKLKEKGLLRMWRVMVVMPEQHISRPVPDPAGETEFIRQFVSAGYKVIDQKQYAHVRDQLAADIKNPALAAEIGKKFGADVIITGEAFSQRAEIQPNRDFISCSARVEARAILVDTAEIVAADAETGAGANLAEAVAGKTAIQRTAAKLAPLFVRDVMTLPAAQTRKLTIEIIGFKRFTAASNFEKALAKLPGINSVTRESYDKGVLVLEVDAGAESAEDVAGKLEEADALKGLKLAVQNVSRTRIRAQVEDN